MYYLLFSAISLHKTPFRLHFIFHILYYYRYPVSLCFYTLISDKPISMTFCECVLLIPASKLWSALEIMASSSLCRNDHHHTKYLNVFGGIGNHQTASLGQGGAEESVRLLTDWKPVLFLHLLYGVSLQQNIPTDGVEEDVTTSSFINTSPKNQVFIHTFINDQYIFTYFYV